MSRRVVVTGMGCASPLGIETETVWTSLLGGVSGAAAISLFDASSFPVTIAAEVKDWSPDLAGLDDETAVRTSRQAQFALYAAGRACVRPTWMTPPGIPCGRGSTWGAARFSLTSHSSAGRWVRERARRAWK